MFVIPNRAGNNVMIRISPVLLTWIIAAAILLTTLSPSDIPLRDTQLSVSDKLLHALAFGMLVFAPHLGPGFKNALWLVPLALAFGGLIELVQPMVGTLQGMG